MFPSPCKNLIIDHTEYLSLLKKVRKLPGIKKVFIRSGLRYDYLIHDKNDAFFKELCEHHISGQLKVAPEHVVPKVLNQMGKPTREVYDKFVNKYFQINKQIDKKQFLVPYLMSSHPGSDLNAAIDLALYIKEMGYTPEQVQDFYPTPGSLSTTMYYTGFNPITGEKVYIPKTPEEKEMQRALIQFAVPKNYQKVKKALLKAHREDLIGNSKNCLIGFAPGKLGYQGKHKSNDGPRNNSNKNSNVSSKISNEKNSMSKEFISVNLDITVGDTIEILKETKPDEEVIYYIYITDEEERVQGVVSLRDLIVSDSDLKIREIMDYSVSRVRHDDEISEAIEVASKYDLNSVPVVDEYEKLIGIVIIHDLIDEFLYPLWKKKN